MSRPLVRCPLARCWHFSSSLMELVGHLYGPHNLSTRPARERRGPLMETPWLPLARPLRIRLDQPLEASITCLTCGETISARVEAAALRDQVETTGRVTIERACPKCEQLITVMLEVG